ncbi:hypothetical protein [Flavicella marina]|uniref:hypothetical protein n=1 Tax=Flavicella marina TaxID=1475951 RepID=UPI0012659ED0|nr:hypothetical protein [Flavicella marina]
MKEKTIENSRKNISYYGLLVTGDSNWLRITREDTGQVVSIAKYTRAKNMEIKGSGAKKREHFIIDDWPYKNVKASVKALPDSRSRFGPVDYNVGASLYFESSKNLLTVNPSGIQVKAGIDPYAKLKPGTYGVFLPDAPHKDGQGYLDRTGYALTWFFIKDDDNLDRYVHCGARSLGCVTVGESSIGGSNHDIKRWTEIAEFLSTQRVPSNNNFVGYLKVV